MNKKDQQQLAEAYQQVIEAAPTTLGQRYGQYFKQLGTKALLHFFPFLEPAVASTLERLNADKQARDYINKTKAELEATYKVMYGGYTGKADTEFVTDFLNKKFNLNSVDPRGNLVKEFNKINKTKLVLTDNEINNYIKAAYATYIVKSGGRLKAQPQPKKKPQPKSALRRTQGRRRS